MIPTRQPTKRNLALRFRVSCAMDFALEPNNDFRAWVVLPEQRQKSLKVTKCPSLRQASRLGGDEGELLGLAHIRRGDPCA